MMTTNTKSRSEQMKGQATAFDFYDLMMSLSHDDRVTKIDEINSSLGYSLLDIHEMARYELKLANMNEKRLTLAERIAEQKAKEEVEYAAKVAREMQKGYMALLSNQ